jgi:hypothetical protein
LGNNIHGLLRRSSRSGGEDRIGPLEFALARVKLDRSVKANKRDGREKFFPDVAIKQQFSFAFCLVLFRPPLCLNKLMLRQAQHEEK